MWLMSRLSLLSLAVLPNELRRSTCMEGVGTGEGSLGFKDGSYCSRGGCCSSSGPDDLPGRLAQRIVHATRSKSSPTMTMESTTIRPTPSILAVIEEASCSEEIALARTLARTSEVTLDAKSRRHCKRSSLGLTASESEPQGVGPPGCTSLWKRLGTTTPGLRLAPARTSSLTGSGATAPGLRRAPPEATADPRSLALASGTVRGGPRLVCEPAMTAVWNRTSSSLSPPLAGDWGEAAHRCCRICSARSVTMTAVWNRADSSLSPPLA
mmetsp:Transcript_64988/g.173242  ORF Transcript_64988/g.173242 Transcript_64988/m.173242 type:complete len:268 (-) Transcript_64988:267-1070(-)